MARRAVARCRRVALGLGLLDLIEQQFEPIKFATNLGLKMHRQGTGVARRRLVEPFAPIAAQRLVTRDALENNSPLTRLTS